jgi:hypothetical protein
MRAVLIPALLAPVPAAAADTSLTAICGFEQACSDKEFRDCRPMDHRVTIQARRTGTFAGMIEGTAVMFDADGRIELQMTESRILFFTGEKTDAAGRRTEVTVIVAPDQEVHMTRTHSDAPTEYQRGHCEVRP